MISNRSDRTARIYLRVSTQLQAEEGYGLPAQRAKLRAYCEYQGWGEPEEYQDAGISGARDDRPGLTALLADLKHGDVVLVHALSRLGRGGAVQLLGLVERITTAGARLVSLSENIDTDTPAGRLMLTILAALGQMEVELTRERTEYGRVQAASEGIYPGSPVALPLGYARGEDGRIAEDEHAPTVRLMYELAAGRSFLALANELNARGVPGPRGDRWYPTNVMRILRRETYHTGHLVYRQAAHPGNPERWITLDVPPLVTPEVWLAAQRTRSSASAHARPDRYPLTGHLVCLCGARLQGKVNMGRDAVARYTFYRCGTAGRGTRLCPATGRIDKLWHAGRAEASAREVLLRLLTDPHDPGHARALYHLTPPPDPHAEERGSVARRLRQLLDLLQDDMIDRAEYDRRYRELKAREAALPPPPLPVVPDLPDLSEYAEELPTMDAVDLAKLLDLLGAHFAMKADGTVELVSFVPFTTLVP